MPQMFQPIRYVSLGELLTRVAHALPDLPALVYPHRSWTFAQLETDCVRLAGALHALGVERGERVVVWAGNIPEWVMLQFALAKLGAILVTANTSLKGEEIGYLLRHSGARTLVMVPQFRNLDYRLELQRAGELPELRRTLVVGEGSWEQLWREAHQPPQLQVSPEQVINMQYTSGTTGFPKGVRLTSANIVTNGYWLGQALGYTPEDRLCLCVPLFHCFGCVIGVIAAYTHGVCLCPLEYFEPRQVLETVERHRCTSLYGVPTMFLAELEHPEFSRFDLSSLRTGVMAGSLCPEALMRRVMNEMHMAEVMIAYGLTETSPAVSCTLRDDPVDLRCQTVGKALPEVELRIVDPTTGRTLSSGHRGELWVRGPNVMEGYHGDPEATAAAINGQGWFRTGDEASLDAQGYLRITGRIKDTIIRGGENIAPFEVETVLRQHPAVLDVAVYGVPCEFYGETVAAALKIRPERQFCPAELEEFCRQHLAHFKVPRHYRRVEEFPLTASGKVQKYRLRETHTQATTHVQSV